jgi:hypothetical protein
MIYVHQTSAGNIPNPSTNEEHLVFDMSMHLASALKVSFSLIIDSTSTYNLFIMRVGPSNTSIIRYRYELAGSSPITWISSNGLDRDY